MQVFFLKTPIFLFLRFQRIALDVSYCFQRKRSMFLMVVFLIKKRVVRMRIFKILEIQKDFLLRFGLISGQKNYFRRLTIYQNRQKMIISKECILIRIQLSADNILTSLGLNLAEYLRLFLQIWFSYINLGKVDITANLVMSYLSIRNWFLD